MSQQFKHGIVALFVTVFCFFASANVFAQSKKTITLSESNITLKQALDAIERQSDYTFLIRNNDVNLSTPVSVNVSGAGIEETLRQVFRGTGISYEVNGNRVSVFSPTAPAAKNQAPLTVSGKVVDANGEPVPGVAVFIEGTTKGGYTDLNGVYSIEVPSANSSIQVACIGYKSATIPVGGRSKIDITMEDDVALLDEAVAIGYGTQRKGDVTSAIASVKSDDFTVGHIVDAGDLIKGKVAGLNVTKGNGDPNGSSTIRLRGIISLEGDSTPLVLIDGIEGDMSTVAAEDIASIDVLKDASAAAIYGTRGANGVILITTKNGSRDSRVTVNYNGYASVSRFSKTDLGFMTAEDVRNGLTDLPDLGYETDWVKEISRTAFTHNHNFTITGGNKTTAFSASATYRNEQGVIKRTYNDELKMKMNLSHWMLNDMLKLSFDLQKVLHKNSATRASSDSYSNIFHQALTYNPTAPVYTEDGEYYENLGASYYYNPVAIINELNGSTKTERTRMTGTITFEPIQGWQTSLMLGTSRSNTHSDRFYTSDYYSSKMNDYTGQADQTYSYSQKNYLELTSTYKHQWDKHRFEALAGYSYEYNMYEGFYAYNLNFPTDLFEANNLASGTGIKTGLASMSSYKNDNKLIGFFGRVSYGYDDRYNVLLSIRREGSSKFGANHKWGTFPSASFRWNLHNEEFMRGYDWLDLLDVRLGWGITGVIPSTSYLSLTRYDYGNIYYFENGSWLPGLQIASNPNPDLKWERSREINLGFDWSIYNGRFGGSLDIYNKKTSDLLWEYAVPTPPNLYDETLANVGVITNKGIEVALNFVPVRTKDLEWKVNLTASHNDNKLVSLSNDLYESDSYIDTGYITGISIPSHRMEEGMSLDNYYGLKSVGVSENGVFLIENPETGEVAEWEASMNTDEAWKQYLGHGLPKLYLGLGTTLNYKNFDMSMQFTGQFGFQILNENRWLYENNTYAFNRMKSVTNPPYGGEYTLSVAQAKTYVSYFLEKGDFLKLTNLTLGYTFPLKNNSWVKGLRAYISGDNLFTITSYSGLDPELSNDVLGSFGNDYHDTYPPIRSFTLGLNLMF